MINGLWAGDNWEKSQRWLTMFNTQQQEWQAWEGSFSVRQLDWRIGFFLNCSMDSSAGFMCWPFVLATFWPVRACCHVLEPKLFWSKIFKKAFFWGSKKLSLYTILRAISFWLAGGGWGGGREGGAGCCRVDVTYWVDQEAWCLIVLYPPNPPYQYASLSITKVTSSTQENLTLSGWYPSGWGTPVTQRSNTGDQGWCSPEKLKVAQTAEGLEKEWQIYLIEGQRMNPNTYVYRENSEGQKKVASGAIHSQSCVKNVCSLLWVWFCFVC